MTSPPGPSGVRVRVTQDLGLFDVTMAAVGAMVGAAIFLLAGATFTVAGPLTLLAVVLAGVVVLLSGLAYAELASGRPGGSGGAYEWVRSALPAPSGFLAGWLSWGGHLAASALGAIGLGAFLVALLGPSAGSSVPIGLDARLIGVLVLGFVSALHFARVHVSARAQGRLTLVKILLLVAIAAIGVASLFVPKADRGPGSFVAPAGTLAAFLGAGVFFIAFQGFEVVAQISDQAKHPERTVPRAMTLAVCMSLAVYVLLFVAFIGNAPTGLLDGWPACAGCGAASEDLAVTSVFNYALGEPWVGDVFLLVGIVSMYGALNANLTSAVKISLGMARDGLLPASLARVGRRETPPLALGITVAGTTILLTFSLETIAILAGISFLILFAFVQAALVALRRRERREGPGFRVPLVPTIPIVAAALNLALVGSLWQFPAPAPGRMSAGAAATYTVALWVAVGLIVHWFGGGRAALGTRAAAGPEVTEVLSPAEEALELERYRVFLPLREFDDAPLVEFGARIAAARNGELSLLNVVEVPRNLPPKAIRFRYVDDRIRGLQRLAKVGAPLGIDVRPVVKIGSKVYEIILDTIREEAVNLLVMGWRGDRVEGDRRILGSNIDYLIENAPCDVVVFKTRGLERPLKRIVVLASPIWGVAGIGELVLVLARADGAAVEVLSLAADPAEAEALKADAGPFLARCQELGIPVEHRVLYTRNWESVAIGASADASLLALQATTPSGMRKYPLTPVEDRIAKLAKCPVLILRKAAPGPRLPVPAA